MQDFWAEWPQHEVIPEEGFCHQLVDDGDPHAAAGEGAGRSNGMGLHLHHRFNPCFLECILDLYAIPAPGPQKDQRPVNQLLRRDRRFARQTVFARQNTNGVAAHQLFGANVGIEIGQLIVILAAASLTAWWWKRAWYQPRIAVPVSLLIGLYGLFAALDRITNLQFPSREFFTGFWSFYDRDYWFFPLAIGLITLGVMWLGYRQAVRVRRFFYS